MRHGSQLEGFSIFFCELAHLSAYMHTIVLVSNTEGRISLGVKTDLGHGIVGTCLFNGRPYRLCVPWLHLQVSKSNQHSRILTSIIRLSPLFFSPRLPAESDIQLTRSVFLSWHNVASALNYHYVIWDQKCSYIKSVGMEPNPAVSQECMGLLWIHSLIQATGVHDERPTI